MALRKETGAGPRQLLFLARRRLPYDRLPAVSTVSLILRKEGLVDRARYRRRDPDLRGPTGPYRPGRAPNEQWTVDFKGHFRLGDRSMCHPLTVQDDATRYVLCVDGHARRRRSRCLGASSGSSGIAAFLSGSTATTGCRLRARASAACRG